MIDPNTARDGAALLAAAIAETFEDHAAEAARFERAPDRAAVAARLDAAAGDVAALAAALRVLVRYAVS